MKRYWGGSIPTPFYTELKGWYYMGAKVKLVVEQVVNNLKIGERFYNYSVYPISTIFTVLQDIRLKNEKIDVDITKIDKHKASNRDLTETYTIVLKSHNLTQEQLRLLVLALFKPGNNILSKAFEIRSLK